MNQMWDMREINDSKGFKHQQTETKLLFTKIGRWESSILDVLSLRCLLNLQKVMSNRKLDI